MATSPSDARLAAGPEPSDPKKLLRWYIERTIPRFFAGPHNPAFTIGVPEKVTEDELYKIITEYEQVGWAVTLDRSPGDPVSRTLDFRPL